ncbi:hypothetical protein [Virgibacillus ndiopensis]|uniref:hypothetical protein n=1 Tax=Virgibacillus ndiopensis TaxID=2004408 RepID=UPI00159BC621|nr:hypothetical protein [Virgibacillus ndiopensis]
MDSEITNQAFLHNLDFIQLELSELAVTTTMPSLAVTLGKRSHLSHGRAIEKCGMPI